MSTVHAWFENMRDLWLSKEPDKIAYILADPLEYYESPFQKPLTKMQDVVHAWQEIKSQNIEYIKIEILFADEKTGMALWQFKEIGKPLHIGSYYLELNQNGKCVKFRQWWNIDQG